MAKLRLVLLSALFVYAECANILGIFPAPGFSQYILGEKLMKELAHRGHQVTVISPYKPKSPIDNYKTISTEEILKFEFDLDLFSLEKNNIFQNIPTTYELGLDIAENTLKVNDVQVLIRSNETFDLVIVEQFFMESLMGFAAHFNAPLVLFSSIGPSEWNNPLMGNPNLPSISPISWTPFSRHMRFFQRIKNLIASVYNYIYKNFVAYPRHEKLFKQYFPNCGKEFGQVMNNCSLMLLNSHPSTAENAPLTYNMIEIGGFHITENKLDDDIQEYLDSAKDGAILFSLGSNLRSSDLSNDTLNGILNALSKLKQKVLWKFEADLPLKPKNLLISKWLKQSDILAHPNVRLFITHGGLLSVTEAVFHGVPMLGIPIFGDQKMNMARVSRGEFGIVLPFQDLGEESLGKAINQILTDEKFHKNARHMSNLIRDRVVRPLDLAMYWIEHVLRHKGFHFKSPALDLNWAQLYMLDIVAFILLIVIILFSALKYAFGLVSSKKQHTLPKKLRKSKRE